MTAGNDRFAPRSDQDVLDLMLAHPHERDDVLVDIASGLARTGHDDLLRWVKAFNAERL